jgi:predicted DNA-binding protein
VFVASAALAPFSTRLPSSLIERLRVAAPQIGMRQGEIAAEAIDAYLRNHGH